MVESSFIYPCWTSTAYCSLLIWAETNWVKQWIIYGEIIISISMMIAGVTRGIHFSSVQFSCSVVSDSLLPHELQHPRAACPSPTPGVHSNSCPSSQWCHPSISSSVVPFSSCLQSLPASESFPMRQLFAWGGQSIRVSTLASVLPMNSQDRSPLGWTDWIALLSKGLLRGLEKKLHVKN